MNIISSLESIPRKYTLYIEQPLEVLYDREETLTIFLLFLKRYGINPLGIKKRTKQCLITLDSIEFFDFIEKCSKLLNIEIEWNYRIFPFFKKRHRYIK